MLNFILAFIVLSCARLSVARTESAQTVNGNATGIPIIEFFRQSDLQLCGDIRFIHEHNLDRKIQLSTSSENSQNKIEFPKWGIPFQFSAKYWDTNDVIDYYDSGYRVTEIKQLSVTSKKCFDMTIDKDKICGPTSILAQIKKGLAPNSVSFKRPKQIKAAISKLPTTLLGCFINDMHEIEIQLKK